MAANHGNGANAGGPPASSSLLGSTGAHARSESSVADTLPPQPLKELLSAGGANLYVLSRDPELIDTVQRAGGEQFPVFAVAAWAELELAVESGRCGIALLDADLVGGSLAGHIVALQDYAHRVVTLVAADRAVAQGLMGYLSDRRIHRLLIKPPAHGITRLLIESAVNRCLQLRELAAQSEPSEPLRPRPAPRVATRMPIWIPVAAGMTLLAGVGIVGTLSSWWGERSPSGGQPTAQSVTPTAPASASEAADRGSQRFTDLLGRAEQAFREGRLEAPQGDNALDYYLAILAADPTVEPARDGLGDVVDALFAQAEAAMLANELERAAATLDSIRRAEPASGRLVFLDAQLAKATSAARAAHEALAASPIAPPPQKTALPEPQARPSAATPPNELDSLLAIAAARVERGQLLAPVGDSAAEYIDRAAQLAPADPRVASARASLAAALVTEARLALTDFDVAGAAPLMDAARQLGAEPEALAALDVELMAAREGQNQQRRGQLLALAEQRLTAGALLTPTGDSALHYLTELQQEAPAFGGLGAAWRVFASAIQQRAEAAIEGRSWAEAEALEGVLSEVPGARESAAALRDRLEAGRLQEQYLASAAPASDLKLLAAAPAAYPPDALRRNIEGWVELEFVVDRAGRPRDVAVVEAEPEGRFEQAAVAAVSQYRFEPFERAGRLYERRVRQRLRFTLQ